MSESWIDDVLGYWFDELAPVDWWRGTPELDARLHERFAGLYATLATSAPDATTLDARGHLAAILVYDQFPRQLFRGVAAAFATDGRARAFADDAIARGLDVALPKRQRHFVYLPFSHGESAAIQQRSVALFASLDDSRALQEAERHRATIERFGRFPARNAALGRASTADEVAYLARKKTVSRS